YVHTCAITTENTLRCWGANWSGQAAAPRHPLSVLPVAQAITRLDANPTGAASVAFQVTFSQPVIEVDAADFTLATSGGISGAQVVAVSGGPTAYTVTVATGSGNGTLRLDVRAGASIYNNAARNPLYGGFTSGEAYTLDRSIPIVRSITRADYSPTSANRVAFFVSFSEAVTGVSPSSFSLTTDGSLSGESVVSVSGGPITYTVTVATGSGNGALRLDVRSSGTSIRDLAGNPLAGGFTSGETYSIEGRPDTVINLSISMHDNPPPDRRQRYEEMIRYFADAVFEMSNGAHTLGTVTFYLNGAWHDKADIVWVKESCHPNAHVSGYGIPGLRIEMCDQFSSVNYLQRIEDGGYTLAHEFGHYFYGLYDEYAGKDVCNSKNPWLPCKDDTAVVHSIMNSQWKATNGNYKWLNFSVAQNNTRNTAQHRMYEASGWETLARPPERDPRHSAWVFPTRRFCPNLAAVAPGPNQLPRIDLTRPEDRDRARSNLRIVWADATAQAVPATPTFTVTLHALDGETVSYPMPIRVIAMLQRAHPIIGATVEAELRAPDGSRQPVLLRDDGVAPDWIAEDGIYSGLTGYAMDGTHVLRARFTNPNGAARELPVSGQPAPPPPDEDIPLPAPIPVGESFDVVSELSIEVRNVRPDDHGDTPATATWIMPTNHDVVGRVDRAGDRDVFQVTAETAGSITFRVTGAAGAQPRLRLLSADGTELARGTSDGVSGGYPVVTYALRAGETVYLEISDANAGAAGGFYQASAGEALASDLPDSSGGSRSIYVPLVTR
ncbi:choice-of-anchor X domain-containing protein, partial [Chloroflexus sp.]|uniref:choice-of-anchor X domain-containing protein n=1 Tax=Chloroflexus sp. TaxID=1904827 RepID=UPI002FDA63AD